MRLNCCDVVSHEIVAIHLSCSGIISVYQLGVAHASIVWLRYLWSYLCVICDEVGIYLGWLPFCAPRGHSDF